MPYIGLSPDLPRADITPVSTSNVTSISCNFDSSIVVLGYANENNNTGKVEVYEYFRGSDLWQSRGIIDGPHTNSYFGKSLDTDWDTERIVVGANAASNVYVYDWDGSAFQNYSNIIESPSGTGSDFGFSVRIAKNNPDIITVGSPAHNNVFVYQLVNSSWVETFSNTGTDIQNLAPYSSVNDKVYDTINNLVTTTEYNRYGESVAISNNGNYIIIGQPGTALSNLNATNTTNFDIVEENQKLEGNVVVATRFYLFDSDNQNKQLGSVRVFKTTDGLWNTSNSQVGSLLYGERNFVINQNRGILPGNIPTVSWMNVGWGFPAFGSSVDINDNGDLIVVGSPLYGLYTSYGGNSGKIYTYKLLKDEFGNDIWVEINTLLGTRLSRYGLNIKLDFAGSRLVVNGCNNELDILGIYDLNQEIWYNTLPLIVFNGRINLEVSLHVTDGKTVITSRTVREIFNEDTIGNYILFYNVDLTQAFSGNSTFSGYISASQIYVGANDSLNESTTEYSRSKRISFGGTFNDNTYENTIIENRVYKENDLGLSELILSKVPSGANDSLRGLDIIRVKGVEIHLDSWNQNDDNRYEHHPVLVITQDTCVGIGHSKVDFSDQGGYYLNSVDTHAILDVNGSGYIRNKLNVHYDGRSEILGYLRSQGTLFWDTRRYDTVDGTNVFSNAWPAPSKFPERFSFTSTMSYDVSYSKSNYAFDFGTGSGGAGQIDTGIVGLISSSSETPKISLWFKLKNEQSQYNNNKIFSYGDPTGSRVEFIITTTGIELKFYHLTNTYTLSSTYSFIQNKWYHFYCKLNPPQSQFPSTTSVDIYINAIELTTSGAGTNIIFDYTGRFILGGGILNAYIGMVNLWQSYVSRAPSPENLYNNGPPDELLSVGGSAIIQNKLGVGVTNPTEALEVSGNVYRSGRTFVKHITYTSVDYEYPYIYLGQFNTQSEPSKIHIIDDGVNKGSGATFSVVRHYESTPIINGEQGSAFLTYDFYYEEIDVNAYYLWVQPNIDNGGTYDIHIDSPNYSYGTVRTVPSPATECNYGLRVQGLFDDVRVLMGGGITNPTEALEVSGNIRSYGNVYVGNNTNDTIPKSIYFGGVLRDNYYDHCVIENRIYSETEKSELLLFKGNDPDTTNGPDRIRLRASEIVLDTYNSVTSDRTVENPRLIVDKDGVVTVSNNVPEFVLKNGNENNECRLFFGTPLDDTSPYKTAIIADGIGWSRSDLYFCLDNTQSNDPTYVASLSNARMVIQASGNVGIGTNSPSSSYKLDVNGSIQCNGFNNTASDDRIKYNEEPVSNALTLINLLRPQRYEKILEFPSDPEGRWIPSDDEWEGVKNEYTHKHEYGLIAQDVRQVQELSFLVEGDETYMKKKSVTIDEYDPDVHTGYLPDNVYTHSVTSNVISEDVFNSLTSEEQFDYASNVQSYSKTVETDTPLSLNYNGIFVLALSAIQELDKKLASVLARLDALENPPQ